MRIRRSWAPATTSCVNLISRSGTRCTYSFWMYLHATSARFLFSQGRLPHKYTLPLGPGPAGLLRRALGDSHPSFSRVILFWSFTSQGHPAAETCSYQDPTAGPRGQPSFLFSCLDDARLSKMVSVTGLVHRFVILLARAWQYADTQHLMIGRSDGRYAIFNRNAHLGI